MGFVPQYSDYISQVRLPGYNEQASPNYHKTFYIKDSEARAWIETLASAGIKFTIAWDGESVPNVNKIPLGVVVKYNNVEYTGTLVASATTAPYITLVYERTRGTGADARKIYGEYVTVTEEVPAESGESGEVDYDYWWEKLGNTDIVIDDLGDLAYYDDVQLQKGTGDLVLGVSTTFTNSPSDVTIKYGKSQYVTSYEGEFKHLDKSSVYGVSGTEQETASYATPGTERSIGNANVGNEYTLAKAASSATAASYIGDANTSKILQSVSVDSSTECLSFGDVGVNQRSIWGVKTKTQNSSTIADTATFNGAVSSTDTITPYSFSDVDVPIRNTDPTSYATGAISNNGTGAEIMSGLGTANKDYALSSLGGANDSYTATGSAAAQQITVGDEDEIKVAKYDDLDVSPIKNS